MTLVILYVSSLVAFLAIDFLGLSYIIKPVFERDIGHLLAEDIRIGPAFAFYAFFVAVVLWFVSWPALQQDKSLLWVFGNAALIGAAGYGTYEFTSLAVMKDWTWQMALTDFTWGTCLTGVVAVIGVVVTRAVG